jgi:hypothetical protein
MTESTAIGAVLLSLKPQVNDHGKEIGGIIQPAACLGIRDTGLIKLHPDPFTNETEITP